MAVKSLDAAVLHRFLAIYGDSRTLVSKYKDRDNKWVYVIAYLAKKDQQEFLEALELHGYQFSVRHVDNELEIRNI